LQQGPSSAQEGSVLENRNRRKGWMTFDPSARAVSPDYAFDADALIEG